MKHPPEISVVVPVFNEEGNISALDAEIKAALGPLGRSYEVIYVHDGSTDGSLHELSGLSGATVIEMNRRYGQATALDAGFKQAEGKLVVSLDGDGQNDPRDIPEMIAMLERENLDVVAGWRKHRKDKGNIRVLTRIGRLFRRLLINDMVHDTGCTLRVYRSEAVKSLDIGGEMHRYILALLRWKGFVIGEMVVNHRPRLHGKSAYNFTKAFRGLIDLFYIWFIDKYSQRPLHAFGYMSLFTLLGSFLAGCWSVYGKFFMGLSLNRNGWFFIALFMFLAAIMFFSFGIIIDLLIRQHLNSSPFEKRYYIRSITKR